jgi:hypothetical protein
MSVNAIKVAYFLKDCQNRSHLETYDNYERYVGCIKESKLEDKEKESAIGMLDLLFDFNNIKKDQKNTKFNKLNYFLKKEINTCL